VGERKNRTAVLGSGELREHHGPERGRGIFGSRARRRSVLSNPSAPPENTAFAPDVDFLRFVRRRARSTSSRNASRRRLKDPKVQSRLALRDKAIRMMFSSRLRALISKRRPRLPGALTVENDFGRGCLLARRARRSWGALRRSFARRLGYASRQLHEASKADEHPRPCDVVAHHGPCRT